MEINEITQERIADKLLSAMKREGLMSKEVAKIFDVPPSYMSSLVRNRDNVPQPAWIKFRDWEISGKPLRDWKCLPSGDIKMTVTPVDTYGEPIVKKATTRKEAKKHKKELAEAIARSVATEDGTTTVDVSELNQRTGTRVTVDIMEGGYVITVTNLKREKMKTYWDDFNERYGDACMGKSLTVILEAFYWFCHNSLNKTEKLLGLNP